MANKRIREIKPAIVQIETRRNIRILYPDYMMERKMKNNTDGKYSNNVLINPSYKKENN